jgi:hypothetical protein
LRGDDRVFVDFEPHTGCGQLLPVVGAAERLGEPVAQSLHLATLGQMRGDDRLLAGLKRAVEIVGQDDIAGDEAACVEGALQVAREIDQHKAGAELVGGVLDLGEAVHGRGIDPGNQAKVE